MLNNAAFPVALYGRSLLLVNVASSSTLWISYLNPLLWLVLYAWFPGSQICPWALHFKLEHSLEIKTKLTVELRSRKMCYERNCIICSKDEDDLWIVCYLGFWTLLVPSLPVIIERRDHLFYLTFLSFFSNIFKKHLRPPFLLGS